MRHANTGFDALRISQRRKVIALRLDDEPNRRTRMDVEYATLDQEAVDRRVEPAVVDDVVDVPVDIVVGPSGLDGLEGLERGPGGRGRTFAHGGKLCQRRQYAAATRKVPIWIRTVSAMS